MRTLAALTLLMLLLAGCVSTPETLPEAADAPAGDDAVDGDAPVGNLWLLDAPRPFSATVSSGDEPIILVDKMGSGTLWIGTTSGIHRSVDGGATWTTRSAPILPGLFVDGWSLAQDDAGTLYAANTQGQTIAVSSSADGGATWTSANYVAEIASIADRPWLAARGDGEVALLHYGDNGESCAYSTDGGKTWPVRAILNTGEPNAGNAFFDSQGRLWYASDGRVHYWSSPCQGPIVSRTMPANGPQIFTQVAVDATGASYAAEPTSNSRAMTIRAFATPHVASSAVRVLNVSAPVLQSNTFGAIAVQGDEIAVAWYGSEAAGNPSGTFSGQWNVYVARVTGFWTASPTIVHDRITTEANHVGGFCMNGIACTPGTDRDLLDYFGIAHDASGNLHIAYGHDGAGTNSQTRYAFLPAL